MTIEQLEAIAEDPRGFLSRGFRADALILAKRERIEQWRMRAESITVTLKHDSGLSGGSPSKIVETAAIAIVDLQGEIEEQIYGLIAIQREISAAIQELVPDNTQRLLLEMRYVNQLKWEEIAVRMNYAFRSVHKLHNRTCRKLQATAGELAAKRRPSHAL
jgi:DNA-directed RNA polymerase specialized sigma24 family protein